jgi:hypothetical protein
VDEISFQNGLAVGLLLGNHRVSPGDGGIRLTLGYLLPNFVGTCRIDASYILTDGALVEYLP